MEKKGFTLIELLAIIVILAIIAVITVPIVLNIIENAKQKAAVASAYGYKDAIYKYYITTNLTNSEIKMNGTYSINNGIINGIFANNVEIPINGSKPSSGYLIYENNNLKSGCLLVEEYEIKYNNGKFKAEGKGDCALGKIDTTNMEIGIKDGNIQYYTGGPTDDPDNAIYFDPINGIYNCDTYDISNSTTGYNGTNAAENQTTCLRWYVYSIDEKETKSESDDVVNMILDHETTSGIPWNNTVFGGSCYNSSGPNKNFLTQFRSDTEAWTSEKILAPSPYVAAWVDNGTTARTYTITYTTKARLIEADEVARIFGNDTWSYTSNTRGITKKINFIKKMNGYSWTSSPQIDSLTNAWQVNGKGNTQFDYNSVNNTFGGIAPVISIKKINTL